MDYDLGGSFYLQEHLISSQEYQDIFSYNVKGKAMQVPLMEFTVSTDQWESNPNRLPSRHISVEKHDALNKMIDELLDLQVVQPSKETAWSQVHLTQKVDGVLQWIIVAIIKFKVSNEGWQIRNMWEMHMQIGHKNPRCFAVADLRS